MEPLWGKNVLLEESRYSMAPLIVAGCLLVDRQAKIKCRRDVGWLLSIMDV